VRFSRRAGAPLSDGRVIITCTRTTIIVNHWKTDIRREKKYREDTKDAKV
jgi:hypothetical protein